MLRFIFRLHTSAALAVIVAVSMAGTKAALAEHLPWPFAIVEYLAAAMLLAGAILVFRGGTGRLLTTGWGFTAGITWSTLFHHLQEKPAPGLLEVALGSLLGAAFFGIAMACAPRLLDAMKGRSASGFAAGLVLVLGLGGLAIQPSPARASTRVPDLVGRWSTPGGDTIEFGSCAEQLAEPLLCGRIVALRDPSGRDRRDINNPSPANRSRPIVGLELAREFKETTPGVWNGGELYNPDDGRTYRGAIRLQGHDTLQLQGCALMVFCRTQTWNRARP